MNSALAPVQVKQLNGEYAKVQAGGHGEVTLLYEDGHPRQLRTKLSFMIDGEFFEQLTDLCARVQRRGFGEVNLVVRNGKATRIEITTYEAVQVPAELLARHRRHDSLITSNPAKHLQT